VLKAAVERGWPFIAHYEFAAAGSDYEPLMGQFEDAARKYPNHPFMLIHMGQLGPQEAGQLIKAHPNVYFITSHSNPVNIARHPNQPWSNMFDDNDRLSPGWRALVLAHPERFVLAFDNVFPEFWGSMYLDQAALWRTALSALPATVAHAVAHGNAERLWKLPLPTR
jgi:predicted TIM-barrel fold metal-dependent hydrolase